MRVACPSCRALFDLDADLADGPGLPLCDACSGAGLAPPAPPVSVPVPPPRRSRPKVPAMSFGKRRSADEEEDRAQATSAEADERAEDRALDSLGMDPPEAGSPAPGELGDLRSDSPPPPVPAYVEPSSGLMDIRRLAAALPSKPSYFRVEMDSILPPDEIPVTTDDDDPPSSGHADLQSLVDPPSEDPDRVADALLHLDGGLFRHAPARTIISLSPPPATSGPLAPVLSLDRAGGSSRPPAPLLVAPVAQIDPARATKSTAPGRGRGALGWVAGVVVGSAITGLVVARLSTNLPPAREPASTPSAPREDAREAVVTAAPRPSSTPSAPRDAAALPSVRNAVDAPAPSSTRPTAEPARDPAARPSATPRDPSARAPAGTATARASQPAGVTAAPAPAPTAVPAPAPAGGDFDRSAAKAALAAAASMAAGCKQPDDPSGGARVSVTFALSGRVTSAKLVSGAFGGTKTGGCIVRAFRSISVPAFAGDPVTVTKDISVQ